MPTKLPRLFSLTTRLKLARLQPLFPPRPPGWIPIPLPHTATAEEKHLVTPISSQPEKETVDQSLVELLAANPNGRASRSFRALCIPNSGRAYRVFWIVIATVPVLVGLGVGFGVGFKPGPRVFLRMCLPAGRESLLLMFLSPIASVTVTASNSFTIYPTALLPSSSTTSFHTSAAATSSNTRAGAATYTVTNGLSSVETVVMPFTISAPTPT